MLPEVNFNLTIQSEKIINPTKPEIRRGVIKLDEYRGIIGSHLFKEINSLAKDLRGLKVFHVNATSDGGGVAEILKSLVPLMRGVGLEVKWYNILPCPGFFDLTKRIHNALQGKRIEFSRRDRDLYMRHMESMAKKMEDMRPDVWVIHDPQPAGLISYLPRLCPMVWRIHIDTSGPNKKVWSFFQKIGDDYDRIIFTSKDFIGHGIPEKKIRIFSPAIDPIMKKNESMDLEIAKKIMKSLGINLSRPLAVQVSRFDPWKDPMGVIRAYQEAKKEIPGLQLALLGLLLAKDDPEAEKILKEVEKASGEDPDIFLFSRVSQIGNIKINDFVNAFQMAASVVLQKSTKEGFGLSVTEAMWKGQPVIGGNVGGIKLQIKDGENGFLVNTCKEAAQRMVELIKSPQLKKKMGQEAKEIVREKFLIPRLLRDYLKMFKELVK
ncbi:MAG: glycosyltransferase [Candidatus Pacebacteria bacterium]|nr:glycosyltransferase [Candidatus Paceibacterota bacterium]